MIAEFLAEVFAESIGATVIIAILGYLFRETIFRYVSGKISAEFEKEIETTKSDLRRQEREIDAKIVDKEKEIERIAAFLSQMKGERNTILLNKKIQAAEDIMKAISAISKMTTAVETLKVLKIDRISKEISDPKLQSLFKFFESSLKLNENLATFSEIDLGSAKLYVDERPLAMYTAYSKVIHYGVTVMKCLSIGIDPSEALKSGSLRKEIEKLFPSSKEGFDNYGETYAFYWLQSLHDETVRLLRVMVHGIEQDVLDTETAATLSVHAQLAQQDARSKLLGAGFPKELIKTSSEIPRMPQSF